MADASNIASEAIKTTRLGVVAVFGIVILGIWFCATNVPYLSYLFGLTTFLEMDAALKGIFSSMGASLAWIIGFVIVYVSGAVLRILPPDGPDSFSLFWIRWRDADALIKRPDRFPYQSLPTYLADRQLLGLRSLVPWNAENTIGKRSKTFLHFIKLYIASKDARLSDRLAGQEAFLRLLSGIVYATLSTIPVLLLGVAVQHRWNQLAIGCLAVSVFNLLVLIGILYAFHYQRLRELVMILSVYHLVGPPEKVPYNEPPAYNEPDATTIADEG